MEGCWKRAKVAYNATEKKTRKSEVWISVNTWKEIEERSKLKNKVSDAKL